MNEFDVFAPIYVWCMDHHKGQDSIAYLVLSALSNTNLTDSVIQECRESEIYAAMDRTNVE
jgi:hypothetical protein